MRGSRTAAGTYRPFTTLSRAFDGVAAYSYGPGGWNDVRYGAPARYGAGRALLQGNGDPTSGSDNGDASNIDFAGVGRGYDSVQVRGGARSRGAHGAPPTPPTLQDLRSRPHAHLHAPRPPAPPPTLPRRRATRTARWTRPTTPASGSPPCLSPWAAAPAAPAATRGTPRACAPAPAWEAPASAPACAPAARRRRGTALQTRGHGCGAVRAP